MRKRLGIILCALLAINLVTGHLPLQAQSPVLQAAKTLYVAPSGTDGSNNCLDSVSPCRTLQHAVNLSASGDTVKVAEGTYTGVQNVAVLNSEHFTATQLVAITHSLTVKGGYSTSNWESQDSLLYPTILDAETLGRVVYIVGDIKVRLDHLAITRGSSAGLGGRYLSWSGEVRDIGSGILSQQAELTLRNCTISVNGGYGQWLGAVYAEGKVNVQDSTFTMNKGDCNAGLYLLSGDYSQITGNAFLDNHSGSGNCYMGSGLYAKGDYILVTNNTFTGNYGYGGGGLGVNGRVTVRDNLIRDNEAMYGGGVFISGGEPLLERNFIMGNVARQAGGALASFNCWPACVGKVYNNMIISNIATADSPTYNFTGGGVAMLYGSRLTMEHNTMAGNVNTSYPAE